MEIALAAVKLAHEASGGAAVDEEDIPDVPAPKGDRGDRPARPGGGSGGGPRKGRTEGMTRIFIGAGRSAGIRPQDLVGAITGESDLTGRQIGAIEIADRFALVEVPQLAADDVIAALRTSTIKGRKATVRRERYEQRASQSGRSAHDSPTSAKRGRKASIRERRGGATSTARRPCRLSTLARARRGARLRHEHVARAGRQHLGDVEAAGAAQRRRDALLEQAGSG
jgi:hypothetical protein